MNYAVAIPTSVFLIYLVSLSFPSAPGLDRAFLFTSISSASIGSLIGCSLKLSNFPLVIAQSLSLTLGCLLFLFLHFSEPGPWVAVFMVLSVLLISVPIGYAVGIVSTNATVFITKAKKAHGSHYIVLQNHNFLVAVGGLMSAVISFFALLTLDILSMDLLIIASLAIGFCISAVIFFFNPKFFYRKMAVASLLLIGVTQFSFEVNGGSSFGTTSIDFGSRPGDPLTSSVSIVGSVLIILLCIYFDYKIQNKSPVEEK